MRRLDDIYHDTVSRVLGCLATLPDLTKQHPSLVSLITSLKVMRPPINVFDKGCKYDKKRHLKLQ